MNALPAAVLALAIGWPVCAAAAENAEDAWRYEDDRVGLRLTARTADQTAAFYSARGFPPTMIELIRERCFLTTVVTNRGQDIVWLEPARWRFGSADGEIARFDRSWWNDQWEALEAPLPSRATFRWTLLPERLDLRPGETEGGNLTLPRVPGPFWLEARFATGAARDGAPLLIRVDGLRCPAEAGS
jgi:hypothetical protein